MEVRHVTHLVVIPRYRAKKINGIRFANTEAYLLHQVKEDHNEQCN